MLQPQIVMAVVITASGAVAKRTVAFDDAGRPELAEFGPRVPQRDRDRHGDRHARRCAATSRRPTSPSASATSWRALAPVFTELVRRRTGLYVGGASRLMSELRARETLRAWRALVVAAGGARRSCWSCCARCSGRPAVSVRIGVEHADPVLQPLAVIAASYGIARRPLGTVSLVGPTRMDYPAALGAPCAARPPRSRPSSRTSTRAEALSRPAAAGSTRPARRRAAAARCAPGRRRG